MSSTTPTDQRPGGEPLDGYETALLTELRGAVGEVGPCDPVPAQGPMFDQQAPPAGVGTHSTGSNAP